MQSFVRKSNHHPETGRLKLPSAILVKKKTSLFTHAALSRHSVKTEARLKSFICPHTHPYCIFLCKILFKIKNGELLLPEPFKLVGIMVLHPYDIILILHISKSKRAMAIQYQQQGDAA